MAGDRGPWFVGLGSSTAGGRIAARSANQYRMGYELRPQGVEHRGRVAACRAVVGRVEDALGRSMGAPSVLPQGAGVIVIVYESFEGSQLSPTSMDLSSPYVTSFWPVNPSLAVSMPRALKSHAESQAM